MAGHSKWANIKHKKEKTDAQKGKAFTKIGREIAVVVKAGGSDPESNLKLKEVIAKAKLNNMPNETIMRSIKRASGDMNTENYEEITYEGYGPCGVAVIVKVLTDNRNRTAGELRHYFDKFGGNLGQNGSVSYLFDNKGVIIVEKTENLNDEEFMLDLLELGAEDINSVDECFEIITPPDMTLNKVCEFLEEKKFTIVSAEYDFIPQTSVELSREEDIIKMERLLSHLEDNDDVQDVYHNLV